MINTSYSKEATISLVNECNVCVIRECRTNMCMYENGQAIFYWHDNFKKILKIL